MLVVNFAFKLIPKLSVWRMLLSMCGVWSNEIYPDFIAHFHISSWKNFYITIMIKFLLVLFGQSLKTCKPAYTLSLKNYGMYSSESFILNMLITIIKTNKNLPRWEMSHRSKIISVFVCTCHLIISGVLLSYLALDLIWSRAAESVKSSWNLLFSFFSRKQID